LKNDKSLCDKRQLSFDDFLITNFTSKLNDLSSSLSKCGSGKPVVLYTTLLDEENEYGEQELAIINERYVVIQVITFGGYVPLAIQHQQVFTFDEFSIWIFKRSASLFLQCLSTLDDALLSIKQK
jgi:flagellar biosynthesis GTPase FlhF